MRALTSLAWRNLWRNWRRTAIALVAIVLAIVLQILLFRSRWGLRTRSVGENPRDRLFDGWQRGVHADQVEQALDGAVINDTVEVSLTPEEGFGPHDPDLTYTDDLENVPEEFRNVGAEVEMMNDQGDSRKFTVTRIAGGKLTVDGDQFRYARDLG